MISRWIRIRGLSPPTRGSLSECPGTVAPLGSIPAHAGEPITSLVLVIIMTVYPRPRGGAGLHGFRDKAQKGLSPPTRGSREHDQDAP